MIWTIGARAVIGCGCVAVVEWRAPGTPSLYAVRIDRGLCGARRHTAGRRILASINRGNGAVPPSTSDATQPSDR
jgi:hypothetical protein